MSRRFSARWRSSPSSSSEAAATRSWPRRRRRCARSTRSRHRGRRATAERPRRRPGQRLGPRAATPAAGWRIGPRAATPAAVGDLAAGGDSGRGWRLGRGRRLRPLGWRLRPRLATPGADPIRPRGALLAGARAGADLRGARLLARARVAVQRAALDGLVDRPHELTVLGVGDLGVPALDRGLQAAEVRLDRRRVAAVLEALALGPEGGVLLLMGVGHVAGGEGRGGGGGGGGGGG